MFNSFPCIYNNYGMKGLSLEREIRIYRVKETQRETKNMIEQVFKLTQGNERTVEKVILDENIHYMHMILNKGEIGRASCRERV